MNNQENRPRRIAEKPITRSDPDKGIGILTGILLAVPDQLRCYFEAIGRAVHNRKERKSATQKQG